MKTNTLNKNITSSFFVDPDNGYNQLQAFWSGLVNHDTKHNLTSTHHLLYAILRGKDWRKGFTKGLKEEGTYPEALDLALGLNYPWHGFQRKDALKHFIDSGIVVRNIEEKIKPFFDLKSPDVMWQSGYVNAQDTQSGMPADQEVLEHVVTSEGGKQ